MMKEADMNIDYDKLRKKLVARRFSAAFMTGTFGDFGNCVNAYDATPEELVNMARRAGINLEKFKIK